MGYRIARRNARVCVHDILLLRRHCQVEQEGREWVVIDLVSKNGTYLNGQEIGRHVLGDGEAVRIWKDRDHLPRGRDAPVRGGAAMNKPATEGRARLRPIRFFEGAQ